MELQIDEQRSLIEKYVKNNIKYRGNEDLFEDFCNESYQKSYIIFNSGSSIQKIESYVSKVVNTSILTVLKDAGRLKRTSGGYIKSKEVFFDEIKKTETVNASSEENISDLPKIFSYDIEDPKSSVEDEVVTKELLQKAADAVCILHSENTGKNYLEIYESRYIKGMKQKEIAEELNISQSEVSKRLLELVMFIKERIK